MLGTIAVGASRLNTVADPPQLFNFHSSTCSLAPFRPIIRIREGRSAGAKYSKRVVFMNKTRQII